MLVLSRKKNEAVVIGDDITITVIEIRGDKVRLGVEVPRHVPVHRGEVHEAIHGTEFQDDRQLLIFEIPRSELTSVEEQLQKGATVRFTSEGGFYLD